MTHNSKEIEEKSVPLPITQAALRIAQQFADQQTTPEKKEQVYLNTLAVCVVNDYMQIMDIPTDLRASDSWNPAMRLYADVADLKLTELGHLECRPVYSATGCYIPPEVPDDRIGLVVVEVDAEHQAATLLGFAKTVRPGEAINQLQPIDDLLEHLDRLERNQSRVNLSQWLENVFEASWQSVEAFLAPKTPAFRYRNGVTRAKLVDLGIKSQFVTLVVTLTPKSSMEIQILLQVHPTGERTYLPDDLTVNVLDQEGTVVMEAHAGTANSYITLEFSVQIGEHFSITLELGDISLTENFIV